ncbi:MAG: tetratricopeptide repeat protein, partial [Armatimonadota bacterium]|nr:tetratricopeptide repeat protein [Armatimonadota bacterium]
KDPTIKRHANLLHHLLDLQRQIGDEAWRATAREYIAAMSKSGAAPGDFAKLEIAYYYENSIKEAAELSAKFLEAYPTHGLAAEAMFIRGKCLLSSGDKEGALAAFDSLVVAYGKVPTARTYTNGALEMAADILGESGRVNEAVRRIDRATTTNAEEKAANLDHKGCIYLRAGNWKEAARAFERERQTGGVSSDVIYRALCNLGECYYRTGDLPSARLYMTQIVDRWPDSAWARKARGQLYLWGQLDTGANDSQRE